MINKIGLLTILYLTAAADLWAQCPTSGTITSNCTAVGNMTISGGTLNVNPGVTVTVMGTLKVESGGTLNGTGATFNVWTLSDGAGSTNTYNGGTYNVSTNFSTANGGDFAMYNSTVDLSMGSVSISGNHMVLENTTFTGVTSWTTSVTTMTMTGTDIATSGNLQLENAVINDGVLDAGTNVTLKNSTVTNSTLNSGGKMTIENGNVVFDNSTLDLGTSNLMSFGTTALDFSGNGVLTMNNNTQVDIRGDIVNNEWYIDNSHVRATGNFDNAGNEILVVRNNGTFNLLRNFDNRGNSDVSADNGGFIDVGGNFDNRNGGAVDVNGGTLVVGGTFSGNTPTGDSGDCSGGSGGCCGSSCNPLPVSLLIFEGKVLSGTVLLKWKTVSELNNSFFTLERSNDGQNFEEIAKVDGAGSCKEMRAYEVTDGSGHREWGATYYRLSQTDYDGTHEVLKVIAIGATIFSSQIKTYPNPAFSESVFYVEGAKADMVWALYTISGLQIRSGNFNTDNAVSTDGMNSGTYLLKVQNSNGFITKRLAIK
ncbi:MAG: T9SS type A sorting domain-containing protein [Marinoscillum sp.]|uniref:T9SS type A sorting domain-containing protein n=1 Tax=Marinoscillum sp. TaxID=2024838 RepID=UPI0032F0F887